MKQKLLVFWAAWCGPCKLYHPTVEEFAKNNPDIEVDFVNVTEREDDAQNYGVMSIPFSVLEDDQANILRSHKGMMTLEQLTKFVKGS